ncbi:hypothetical protein Rt10032_c01g0287 [Rhodotorula toruloides]|uniref:Uncharacterized protein n=1 Tax=Rhodotorula toruloides TaxID=5286 RepID=A0A511K7F0_RHOTO|nr:hypothetical protein Rt10032_c01g0287 [Rhodotorula toruloides]
MPATQYPDTSGPKPTMTMPGLNKPIKPTAWQARKVAATGIAPLWAWAAMFVTVGSGALYLYSSSGKMAVDLQPAVPPKNPFKKDGHEPVGIPLSKRQA